MGRKRTYNKKIRTLLPNDNCKDCIHADPNGYCLYILNTGKVRPCDPGDGCTVKESENYSRSYTLYLNRIKKAWIESGMPNAKKLKEEHPALTENLSENALSAKINEWGGEL